MLDTVVDYLGVPANRNKVVRTLSAVALASSALVTAILLAATLLR